MKLSGLTIGVVSRTRDEAVDLLRETLGDEYIESNEHCVSASLEIYRNNMMRVIWIKEGDYRHRGYRFNTVYCRRSVQKTDWFRYEVRPYIVNYSCIYKETKAEEDSLANNI